MNFRLGFALFLLLLPAPLPLSRPAAGEGEISRRVLGISSPREEPIHQSSLHAFLEKPLNHLGFVLDYADPDQPLPDFRPYRAIIVWLSSYRMKQAEQFLPWLLAAMDAGVKLILPDGLQVPIRANGRPVGEGNLNKILGRFGLARADYDLPNEISRRRYANLRPDCYSYETDRFPDVSSFDVFRVPETAAGVEVWQRIESLEDSDIHAVSAVAGEAGFWSLSANLLYYSLDIRDPVDSLYRVAWYLNPWKMLREGLAGGQPAPDVTTFSGARGAYAHVDADGPSNQTQPDVPGPSRYAIEVMLEEIWKKYDFPVTIGLIAGEFDPDLDLRFIMGGDTIAETLGKPRPEWLPPHRVTALKLREIAARIFRLPHVQAGCHAYTHPLNWRDLEPSYAISGYRPSYEMETRGAVEFLNRRVLPPDKPVELFQWSGDCEPPPEPLAILAEMGMENINGGDPMYDKRYDSLFYVCPLSVPKGPYRQVYTSGSNENIYTREWTAFRGAFNNVIETFERSDAPLRLLPVNIYYHIFPAERLAGYRAIQNVYNWAKKRDLCWVTAAEYVRAVGGFLSARLGRTSDGGWWLEDYGICPTLRFDGEEGWVDLEASLNVAGFSRHNDSLYVSLLPGDRAEVRLTGRPPSRPALARASGLIRKVEGGADFWRAECRNWSKGFIELWAPEGEWLASVVFPGGREKRGGTSRTADGRIRLELPAGAGEWIKVGLERPEPF